MRKITYRIGSALGQLREFQIGSQRVPALKQRLAELQYRLFYVRNIELLLHMRHTASKLIDHDHWQNATFREEMVQARKELD